MIGHRLLSVLLVLLLPIAGRAEDVTVSAAISLKESLEATRGPYESISGDHLSFTFASSGQLAAQIQSGAPVDLFLSAAKTQVDQLDNAGKTDKETAAAFIGNGMVLIVPADAKSPPTGFESLADASVHKVAVGEPRSVPAGEYSQQILDHLQLTDKLKGRLIYGLNVRQVLQYVQSGEVDAGLVYLSDAKEAGPKVKIAATADPSWHKPIEYWGVVIAGASHESAAKKFLDYLKTDPSQAVFESHGFARIGAHATTQPAK